MDTTAQAPTPAPQAPAPQAPDPQDNAVARLAQRFTVWTERYLPDAFGFVLVGTLVVFAAGLVSGEPIFGVPENVATATTGFGLVDAWGKGFWALITFTLQMTMIIIGGYVVAVSPPMARVIAWLARIPKTPRGAVAFTAAVAMISGYLNWAFSLIFTAILAREIARLVRGVDYRAIGAMAFLGLGTVWAQGLSGSAALQMSSASSTPDALKKIIASARGGTGLIPLSDTIFLWQGVLGTLVIFTVGIGMAWLLAPSPARARTAEDLGITIRPLLEEAEASKVAPTRPGDWLETSPVFPILLFLLALVYVVRHFAQATGGALNALDFNTINMILLLLGLLLHWRPLSLASAVRGGAGAASGVLLQYPFYGGIFGMIAYTGVSKKLAALLVSASSQVLFPPIIALYSCVLGIFVPSGGSKWLIEAPYVIDAANQLHVNQGWMVVVYDWGAASANLLQPFWMLPNLALLGLRARDLMGYTFAMFLACFPVVLVLVTALARTLPFP